MTRFTALIALFAGMMALTACSEEDKNISDLKEYVDQVKQQAQATDTEKPNYEVAEVIEYEAEEHRSPFKADQQNEQFANRDKQPLEAYPLNKLQFIGIINNDKGRWAIITAPDGKVYEVSVGSYIGNKNGRVVNISNDKVDVALGVDFNGNAAQIKDTVSLTIKENI